MSVLLRYQAIGIITEPTLSLIPRVTADPVKGVAGSPWRKRRGNTVSQLSVAKGCSSSLA